MPQFVIAARVVIWAVLVGAVASAGGWDAGETDPVIFSAGFENGLKTPWGTGQTFDHKSAWWNSGGCGSQADADWRVRRNGNFSLLIKNPTPKGAEVFGTTQQPMRFEKGHRYRIEVWALGRKLASKGAVSLVVDKDWRMRPIELPAGTYDWTHLRGEFHLARRRRPMPHPGGRRRASLARRYHDCGPGRKVAWASPPVYHVAWASQPVYQTCTD